MLLNRGGTYSEGRRPYFYHHRKSERTPKSLRGWEEGGWSETFDPLEWWFGCRVESTLSVTCRDGKGSVVWKGW